MTLESSAVAASSLTPIQASSTTTKLNSNNNDSCIGNGATTNTTTATTEGNTTTKTIYLIRHAESDENRRLGSLKTAFKALTHFALPKTKDIVAAFELVRIDQQINSNVSSFGKQQIAYMANIIRETNFVSSNNIQLIAHSPLLRAKETCRDMFGCILSNTADENSPLLPPPNNIDYIKEVVEIDILTEMTPMEWIPGNSGSLYKRMRAFETWITERPETTIVCVGHSQYFKALLQLPYKFHNCDIIEVQFESYQTTTTWSNVKEVHACRISPPNTDDNDTAGAASSSSYINTNNESSQGPLPTNDEASKK
jgi:hypothetical protein